jgi:hypothetical protein
MIQDDNIFRNFVSPAPPGPAPPSADNFFQPPEGRRKPPPIPTPPQASVPNQLDYSKYATTLSQEAFDQATKLREGYTNDARVKAFTEITPGYVSALQTAPNTSGDLSLINAFAKMMDPISAVREGEAAAVAGSDTLYGQTVARLKKELGKGGTFRPEVRQSLRTEMRRRYDNYIIGYNQAREDYTNRAQFYKLPPEIVVAEPAGAPYAPAIREIAAERRDDALREVGGDPDAPAPALDEQGRPKMEVDLDMRRSPEAAPEPQGDVRTPINPLVLDLLKGAGSVVEGAGNIPGLVANPLVAGVNWAAGTNFRPDLGANLREGLGLPGNDSAMGNVIEAATGAFLPAAAARTAANLVTNPSALASFTTLAKEPIRQTVAAAGGAAAGEGAREMGAGPVGQLAANVLGSLASYGGSKVVAPSRVADPGLARIAAQEDVPIVQPMLKDNRAAINKAGTLEANQSTAPIIQEGFDRPRAGIERGVERLGAGGRASPDRASTGETIRQAAKNIVEGDKRISSAAYKAAEAIDGDPLIDPAQMRAKVDAQIAKLGNNPNANAQVIKELKNYRKDIAGPKPLSAIRDLRTTIRDNINASDLTRSSAQKKADARMLDVLDGTKDDIKAGLSDKAWNAWQKADTGYAASMGYIKDALIPFLGKDFDSLPAEAIADRLTAAAKNNSRAFAELHRRLPPQKQRDLAATFVDLLGKAGPDEPFTTARFISQARKLSNQSRETLFGDRGAQSFNNLLVLSRRLEFAKSQVNVSKTARPVRQAIMQKLGQILTGGAIGGGALVGGTAGAGVGAAVGMSVLAGEAGARALSARRLMDPKLTMALADAASARDPASYRDIAVRLGSLIARDPGLQEEFGPLQQELEKAGGKRNQRDLTVEDTR